jgi:hypothetical protein
MEKRRAADAPPLDVPGLLSKLRNVNRVHVACRGGLITQTTALTRWVLAWAMYAHLVVSHLLQSPLAHGTPVFCLCVCLYCTCGCRSHQCRLCCTPISTAQCLSCCIACSQRRRRRLAAAAVAVDSNGKKVPNWLEASESYCNDAQVPPLASLLLLLLHAVLHGIAAAGVPAMRAAAFPLPCTS